MSLPAAVPPCFDSRTWKRSLASQLPSSAAGFKQVGGAVFFGCTEAGFPDSSVSKESACNAEDPNSIPGSGRSAGEAIGYSLQYCWAFLVAQLVKNPPVKWETWVPFHICKSDIL